MHDGVGRGGSIFLYIFFHAGSYTDRCLAVLSIPIVLRGINTAIKRLKLLMPYHLLVAGSVVIFGKLKEEVLWLDFVFSC